MSDFTFSTPPRTGSRRISIAGFDRERPWRRRHDDDGRRPAVHPNGRQTAASPRPGVLSGGRGLSGRGVLQRAGGGRGRGGRGGDGREFLRRWWWLIPFLIFDGWFAAWYLNRGGCRTEERAPEQEPLTAAVTDAPPPLLVFAYPTDQTRLADTNDTAVYMPTASGRAESALFGTVRMKQYGSQLLPGYHEGIDIGPTKRDRAGRALDDVRAVADGRVGYVNRVAGNSSYGIYVVLLHDDPMGTVYTLYAHLASAEQSLHAGQSVKTGTTLGRMGNTTTLGLPLARSHLHLEIGLINNSRFDLWYRAKKLKPDHGRYHGWNLLSINPLAVYGQPPPGEFSMEDYLRTLPVAFEIVLRTGRKPDFFRRYRTLWSGDDASISAVRLAVYENGLPLSGRPATDEEKAQLESSAWAILSVNEEALGRNGVRIVVKDDGRWRLGKNGEQWRDILLY